MKNGNRKPPEQTIAIQLYQTLGATSAPEALANAQRLVTIGAVMLSISVNRTTGRPDILIGSQELNDLKLLKVALSNSTQIIDERLLAEAEKRGAEKAGENGKSSEKKGGDHAE